MPLLCSSSYNGGCYLRVRVSPDYRRDCINTWIQQHLSVPGAVGGCGGVTPANRQSCLNDLVLQLQQKLLAAEQQPVVGSTYSSVSPSSLQACINSFALRLQVAENGDGADAVCGESDQACINAYVLAMQLRAGVRVLGGCAGVVPEHRQACINNYVLSLQQNTGVGTQQAAAAVSVSATTTSSTAVQVAATHSG